MLGSSLFRALILLGSFFFSSAYAATTCRATSAGTLCTSEVNFSRFFQQAFQDQLQSQWCWAASISMLFAYYGHPVGQSRIVSDVYGAPVNMPAQAGVVMAEQLNRNWVDDKSKSFASRLTGAYDAQAGVLALTNDQIILELDQERPIIIGARTHAMVLTSIQYYATPFGPNIVAGGVFDPWPGVGPRGLQQDELIPAHLGGSLKFVATARVSDASTPGPSSNENGGSAGCTLGTKSTFDPILILLALIASLSLLGRIVVRDDS